MGHGNYLAPEEAADVCREMARLEARGVPYMTAVRRVAQRRNTTVRYVRTVIERAPEAW